MGKRGPKAESPATAILSTRIWPETRAALEAAAAENGRPLSREVEDRLRRSFEEDRSIVEQLGGRKVFALMRFVAAALIPVGETTYFMKHLRDGSDGAWLSDPYAFDQAVKAVNEVLEERRPAGDPTIPPYFASSPEHDADFEKTLAAIRKALKSIGADAAQKIISEVRAADPLVVPPLGKESKRQALARRIATDLGGGKPNSEEKPVRRKS